MWALIVSVPDHCLSFYFGAAMTKTLVSAALVFYAGVAWMFFQSKTSQRLLLTSRPTRLSGMHLTMLHASSTTVMVNSWHLLPLHCQSKTVSACC